MAGSVNCAFFQTKTIAIGTGIEFIGSPNRPFSVKRFQTVHGYGVDVAKPAVRNLLTTNSIKS